MAAAGEVSCADAPIRLTEATEAVRKATDAVQATSRSIAKAVRAGRRPGGSHLDRLASMTCEAPLQSLAIGAVGPDDAKAEIRAAVRYLFKGADGNNRDVVALEIMEIVRQVAADFPRKQRNPLDDGMPGG
jgi:hypothetical protein